MKTDLSAPDFAARRKTFLSKLGKGVAVLASPPVQYRNRGVTYPYRQDSYFFYLTGLEEANSSALFAPHSATPFSLFVEPKDPVRELWDGPVLGPEAAKRDLGADAAYPSIPDEAFDNQFIAAMLDADALYYRVGIHAALDQRIFALLGRASARLGRTGRSLWPIVDPDEILGDMRLYKSKSEVQRMDRAAQISAEAHVSAMRLAKAGMYEYEIEAILYHSFRVHGAARVGYESIIASGPNACVLHYRNNNRRMKDGELLLIDAGAEFEYYSADITRVFPVSGNFSQEQVEIYSAVLKAQKSCIEFARPGKTLEAIHQLAVEVLTEELKRLKILKGPTAQLIKKGEYRPYYPHRTGHWLGMDVHDTGLYFERGQPRKLEPGMVFTIEPGLYFAENGPGPARYKGIGVRIEDDILITPTGAKVLTAGVPKEIEEVESLCSKG